MLGGSCHFFKKDFVIYLCVCVSVHIPAGVCVYVYARLQNPACSWSSKRLWTPWYGCWKPNLPLQELWVLLTPEPSLQLWVTAISEIQKCYILPWGWDGSQGGKFVFFLSPVLIEVPREKVPGTLPLPGSELRWLRRVGKLQVQSQIILGCLASLSSIYCLTLCVPYHPVTSG